MRAAGGKAELRQCRCAGLPGDCGRLLLPPCRQALRRKLDITERAGPAARLGLPASREGELRAELLAARIERQAVRCRGALAAQIDPREIESRSVHARKLEAEVTARLADVGNRRGEIEAVRVDAGLVQSAAAH